MKNWVTKKLGEVYDVRDGTHDSPKYVKEGYALITSKNLKNDNLNYDNVNYISEQDYININKRSKVDVGDVLFAMIGTIGNPIVIKNEPDFAIKNVALFKVPKNQDSYFLKYYLDSGLVIEQMTKDAKGATQKFVGLGYLRSFEIPLPPLPEQKRIVAILDEAFASIGKAKANAEQNLKNAKDLFESYLQGVFENKGEGWEEKTLGEVCDVMNGGTPDTTVSKFWDGEHLWITPKDMGKMKGIYVDNTLRKITDDGLKNSSAKILPPNSIILSSRAPIGHLAINTKPISTNQGCKGLVPKKGVDTLFIYYFLYKSVDLLNSLGTGTTFKELSGSKLTTVIIPIPSLKAQQIIVKKLDALSAETQKLEVIYQNKINDLEELKKSVLQKAFSGELK